MPEHLTQLKEELEAGKAQLIDIREEIEWNAGHLSDAVLLPLSEIQSGEIPDEISKEKKTYIHCRSGNRVQMAQPMMEGEGFDEVIALSEGFEELALEGFEVAED